MEIHFDNHLPEYPSFITGIRRAPDRGYTLTPAQTEIALKNALRYIPKKLHATLAPEFMNELLTRGRIIPQDKDLRGYLFVSSGLGGMSGEHEDLIKTDYAAMDCIDPDHSGQDRDSLFNTLNILYYASRLDNKRLFGRDSR